MGNVGGKTGAQVNWSLLASAVRCSSQVIWTNVLWAMASVCVAVRVRPLNKREKEMSAKVIIHMEGNTTSVDCNKKDIHKGIPGIGLTDRGRHSFSYDFSYDSTDVRSPNFVPQEKVFKDLGCDVLKAAFEGYNACVFAYGETGSGKSYTMIGSPGDLGLIPRICDGLFCQISEMDQVDGASFRTEVSYLEIYNERVQDLLTTKTGPGSRSGLHLREHPKDGPYVENLSPRLVQNYTDIEKLMHAGNAKRTTANTGMNDVSSCSHSSFTIIFTQVRFDAELPCETVSKIHLVDLAGSEKTGARLKEGANINKSLVTLGSVISALADTCVTGGGRSSHTGKRKKQLFIPYRDSLLTWLLKDSLGGNSKTIMIATLSPADVHYGETLRTLRYANRAKNIVVKPTVNEDSGVRVIRELQQEVGRLRGLMDNNNQVLELTKDWTNKWGETQNILKEVRMLVVRHEAPSNQDIGAVIQLGRGTMFRFNHPRDQCKSELLSSLSMTDLSEPTEDLSKAMLFHPGMDMLAVAGLNGDTRQQRSSVLSSPLQTCTVMADGCTVGPNKSPGVLSGLSSDGRSRRLYKAGACYSGPAGTSLGAVVSHLQTGDDRGTEEGTHHGHFPLASSSSTYTQISRFDKHTASLSQLNAQTHNQTEHTASRLDRHRRSQAVRGLPLAALQGQFSRCMMNLSKSTVEGYGDDYKEETQTGARREEEVEQGFRLGSLVSSVSRGEEAQDESQFSASGLGALVRRVSQISGLGVEHELDSLGEESSISGMGSVVSSGVSWMFPGTWRLLHSSLPRVLQQFWDSTGDLQPGDGGRACSSWPSQVVSMVRESLVLSVVKDSQVFSLVRESHMFSYVKDSQVFSIGSELPLVQHISTELTLQDFRSIPIELTQDLQQVESTGIQQRAIDLNTAPKMNLLLLTTYNTIFGPAPSLYPAQNATEFPHKQNTGKEVDWRTGEQNPIRELEWTPEPEGRQEAPSTSEVQITSKEELWSPEDQIKMAEDPQCVTDGANGSTPQSPQEQGDNARSTGPEKSSVSGQEKQWTEGVRVYYQRLVEFPGALVLLQSLPVSTLLGCLQSVLPSVFTSQRLLALYWLGVANCSQPHPHPSLVLLLESCLYALTLDPDMHDQTTPLTVFHHLPLLQIKEIQVGFGGQSLRLTASTEESVLTLYTHSQTLTQALTQALLSVFSPGDQRVAHHPFLKEDLMELSLDWTAQVPDLLLDAGPRVSGHFHKTLADLVYLLHGNMDREKPSLGEVRLLLYTTVGVTTTPDPRPDPWAQLLLTETHLGLVQENAVFHPSPRHLPLLSRQAQFQGVSLRCRSDIRCLMVGDWAGSSTGVGRDGVGSSPGVGGDGAWSSPGVGGDGAGDEVLGGAIRLDIILSRNRRTRGERWDRPRGQPGRRGAAALWKVGRVAEAAILYAASNSCPPSQKQAEVWKLRFSCSSEAACLINHLSNI
ncbi:uncharacterized protein LOC115201723 isoform X2 [Salmo trutta]|uniref:uncharacterized protein LOC115201723 isoform X2 n=1 Tax=Salmo trutta TaxID=8032 RepID=UPI0011307BA9|nr:uncharacterized protein LOC115201723 isoform X2 [Salmo trutta]